MTVTDAELIDLVKTQLGRASVALGDRIVEDLGAESADIVNIIAAVEDRSSLVIAEEDIPGINTVGDLVSLVSRETAS